MRFRAAFVGGIIGGLLVLAGCTNGLLNYDFRAEDATGTWLASSHPGTSIEIGTEGIFAASHLPAELCGSNWPTDVADLDWEETRSVVGRLELDEGMLYSGFLSPSTRNCGAISVYFEQDADGPPRMVVYLVPGEDPPPESIITFVKMENSG